MTTLRLLDAIPLTPQEATALRSPNRKPRYKRERRKGVLLVEKEHLKRLFLRLYRSTGDIATSCDVIGRYESTVMLWRKTDPEFKEAWDEIKDLWTSILSGRFNALGPRAFNIVSELLDGEFTDDDLKAKLAQWILKSQGIGQEKAVLGVEHSGPGGGPIPVRQIVVHITASPVPALGSPAPYIEEGGRVMDGEYVEAVEGEDER